MKCSDSHRAVPNILRDFDASEFPVLDCSGRCVEVVSESNSVVGWVVREIAVVPYKRLDHTVRDFAERLRVQGTVQRDELPEQQFFEAIPCHPSPAIGREQTRVRIESAQKIDTGLGNWHRIRTARSVRISSLCIHGFERQSSMGPMNRCQRQRKGNQLRQGQERCVGLLSRKSSEYW
jgi:hypothetical protein